VQQCSIDDRESHGYLFHNAGVTESVLITWR
jgi:hypothetical protein